MIFLNFTFNCKIDGMLEKEFVIETYYPLIIYGNDLNF